VSGPGAVPDTTTQLRTRSTEAAKKKKKKKPPLFLIYFEYYDFKK